MPQVILGGAGKSSPDSANKKPDKQDNKRALLIGTGVLGALVILIVIVMVSRANRVPPYEKVPPPAGFPDTYPYNSKEYQKRGMPIIGGMPPPSILKQYSTKSQNGSK